MVIVGVNLDDLLDADERSGDQGKDRERAKDDVLDEDPLEGAQFVGPPEDGFDDARHQQTEAGEEDRSHQPDEGFQVGHGQGHASHHDHDSGAQTNLGNVVLVLGDLGVDLAPEDVHRDVELEAEGEQDGGRDQQLGDLGETVG